jgi:hypothetical protein
MEKCEVAAMSETESGKGSLVPVGSEPALPVPPKQQAFMIELGPDGIKIKPSEEKSKKADDKKKMPRGSTVFRHA